MVTRISDTALAVLKDHHGLAPSVTAIKGGVRYPLPVSSCVVTKSAGQQPRCTVSVEVADTSYAPSYLDDVLTPWTTTLDVDAVLSQGTWSETVPVHHGLVLFQSEMTRPEPTFSLDAADQMRRLMERQHGMPRTPKPTQKTLDLLQDYIRRVFPQAQFVVTGADADDAVGDITLDGRFGDAVLTLADGLGVEVFPMWDGRWAIRSQPATAATTPYLLHTGEGGVVTATGSVVTRSYNHVVLRFGNPKADGPDIVGQAQITTAPFAPSSYGYVTYVEKRPGKKTQAQADAAAERKLRRLHGKVRVITITAPCHPHLEPGDTVDVLFANGRQERLVLESCRHDLSPGGTSVLTTRQTSWGTT